MKGGDVRKKNKEIGRRGDNVMSNDKLQISNLRVYPVKYVVFYDDGINMLVKNTI